MQIQDLTGKYIISGTNQEAESTAYKGVLSLTLDKNDRIIAKWLINNNQEQFGTGFFKGNTLVINFHYLGDNKTLYKGVVVYKCITKDVLEGFWSEKHGNPLYLGVEFCFRKGTLKEAIN